MALNGLGKKLNMGQINKYASTRCPLFGQTTPLGLAPVERFDPFAPIYLSVGTSTTAVSGEEHALDVAHTGLLSSGDSLVAGNFALTTAGTAGQWASAIFAKVTQGSTKNVNGYISAAEFEVNLEGTFGLSEFAVLVLNMNNANTGQAVPNAEYIRLRDYGATKAPKLFTFYDVAALAEGGLTSTAILSDTNAAKTHDISIRCSYGTGSGTVFWIMAHSAAPD